MTTNNKAGLMGAVLAMAAAMSPGSPVNSKTEREYRAMLLPSIMQPRMGYFRPPNQRQRRRDARRRGEPLSRH